MTVPPTRGRSLETPPVKALAAVLAAVLAAGPAPAARSAQGPGPRLELAQRYAVPFALADFEAVHAQGAAPGTPELLLLIGTAGEIRLASGDGTGALAEELAGRLRLAEPARSLLDVGPFLGAGEPPCLIVASPAGTGLVRLDAEGLAATEPALLARRARFDLRVGAPRLAPLLSDVNGDGLLDVVLPGESTAELWLRAAAEGGAAGEAPALARAARVRVEATSDVSAGAELLSDRLRASFRVPGLTTADVDGDGRPDLLVVDGTRHAFHLQREDGGFPLEPDVAVDLALFRDTAARPGGMRLGATLTMNGEAQLTRRDLDGDGIPDFVIAQGRKVWVFHGTPAGPQFREPSAILKTAEDVTALAVLHLDDDPWPDLLLLRIELPSVPTLLMGLLASWDVKIRASGYRNVDGRSFELRPSYTADLALRLPPILELLRDPYELIERFQGAGARFRTVLEGDFDGDGAGDLALIDEDEQRIEIWLGHAGVSPRMTREDAERILREQLFGQRDNVWDLERLLSWIEGMASTWEQRLTDGRPPDLAARFELPPGATFVRAATLRPAGAPADRLLLAWRRASHAAGFDLLAWAR